MIGAIFKIFGGLLSGAGTMMAGGALLTSTALTNAKIRNRETDKEETTVETPKTPVPEPVVSKQEEPLIEFKCRITSGKYKIVDIDNNLDILTSTDDFTEARAWLCEYRTNGYRVMLKTK